MHRRHFLSLIATSTLASIVGAACSTQAAATGLDLAVASSLKDVMQALDAAYATRHATPTASIQAAGSNDSPPGGRERRAAKLRTCSLP